MRPVRHPDYSYEELAESCLRHHRYRIGWGTLRVRFSLSFALATVYAGMGLGNGMSVAVALLFGGACGLLPWVMRRRRRFPALCQGEWHRCPSCAGWHIYTWQEWAAHPSHRPGFRSGGSVGRASVASGGADSTGRWTR